MQFNFWSIKCILLVHLMEIFIIFFLYVITFKEKKTQYGCQKFHYNTFQLSESYYHQSRVLEWNTLNFWLSKWFGTPCSIAIFVPLDVCEQAFEFIRQIFKYHLYMFCFSYLLILYSRRHNIASNFLSLTAIRWILFMILIIIISNTITAKWGIVWNCWWWN